MRENGLEQGMAPILTNQCNANVVAQQNAANQLENACPARRRHPAMSDIGPLLRPKKDVPLISSDFAC
jgi:hypothetical protein